MRTIIVIMLLSVLSILVFKYTDQGLDQGVPMATPETKGL